jgi:hypothetical protein
MRRRGRTRLTLVFATIAKSSGPIFATLFPDRSNRILGPSTLPRAYSEMSVDCIIGLFTVAGPEIYRQGVLSLIPRERRQRVGEVLDEMAEALRWWLIAQLLATGLRLASRRLACPAPSCLACKRAWLISFPISGR